MFELMMRRNKLNASFILDKTDAESKKFIINAINNTTLHGLREIQRC